VLESVYLAEKVGLDFFGFGEHHTRSMPLSSPTALVNPPDHTVSLWTESPRVRYSSLTLEKEFQCRQKRTPASSRLRMRLSVGATWRRLPR
jgi:hypothetical protein